MGSQEVMLSPEGWLAPALSFAYLRAGRSQSKSGRKRAFLTMRSGKHACHTEHSILGKPQSSRKPSIDSRQPFRQRQNIINDRVANLSVEIL